MSKFGRPISLQAALVLRHAQATRERAETIVVPAPRRAGFSLARLWGAKPMEVAVTDEIKPRKLAA